MKRSMLGTLCSAIVAFVALALATPATAAAQNAVLHGTIRSDGGEPLAGAQIFISELNIAAATSDAGRYTLTVPGDRVRGQSVQLRVRMVGYRPSSRLVTLVAGDQTVDFQLVADVNRLEEIVVTGTIEGTEQTKIPFAVSRVDMADVPVAPVDPLRLLAGRVPGANVISYNGRPGASPEIVLRGMRSLDASGRNQGPLFIVDGTIITGDLPGINPADIENVEVVKGAAASSLYGARGGNGVIAITTRTGRRSGEGMSYTASTEIGRSDIERDFGIARQTYAILDPTGTRFCRNQTALCTETVDWGTEARRINNVPGDFPPSAASLALDVGGSANIPSMANAYQAQTYPGRTYNAVDQAVTLNDMIQANGAVTGRFGQTRFFASGSHLDQAGALRFVEGFQRSTGRLNLDQNIGTGWTVSFRSYFARSTEDLNAPSFFRLTRSPAIVNNLERDTLGRMFVRPNIQGSGLQNENPLYTAENLTNLQATRRFLGGLTVRYQPAAWLDFEGAFAYDYSSATTTQAQEKGYRSTQAAAVANGSFLGQPYLGFVSGGETNAQSYNTSLNATVRRNLSGAITSRFTLRFAFDQQDNDARSADGNTLNAVGVPTMNNAAVRNAIASSNSSIRGSSVAVGGNFEIRERYILDGVLRREGSSLFGSDARWSNFGRASAAWRMSSESWWPASNSINEFKLRASYGTAGNRPRFVAQYETFTVGAGGIGFGTLGNRDLRPEKTFDTELGIDMELFRRIGVQLTRALSETRDQILEVRAPANAGFLTQWQNAGTLESRTWELAVNLPLITRRDVSWSVRFMYDATRTTISELSAPPGTFGFAPLFPGAPGATNAGNMLMLQAGERLGNIRGKRFLRSCSELPDMTALGGPDLRTQCGQAGSQYQINSDGYVVWTGGFATSEGITRNLWGTALAGGINAPWGRGINWGMPITVRNAACLTTLNTSCSAQLVELGANALPDYSFAVSQSFNFRRLSVFAMLQAVMGRSVWNQGRHWAHLDLLDDDIDQAGRSPEEAKPIGYYWRGSGPDGTGVGGFYDALQANSHFVESVSYAKLRELAVSYNIGSLGGVGNWTASLVGRNLFTITDYTGFDPEVGTQGGQTNSGLLGAVDAFTFPNTRSFTFALSTSF